MMKNLQRISRKRNPASRRTISVRKLVTLLVLAICGMASTHAESWKAPRETLSYDVMYKWGLINKKAGTVTITTGGSASGERFKARLTGATAPWADKFFKVRDTLRGTIDSRTFLPYQYEKISFEGGDFTHDQLEFSRSGNTTKATVLRKRKKKKDSEMSTINKELQAAGPTLDMLSSFYYMRHLDYASMKPGQTVKLNVFSGSKKEILTIHYAGMENVKIGQETYPSFHITFTFTSDAGKTTSDNMDAWLSTTSAKIPLLLEGKLPVGKVRCFYNGTVPKS